MDLRNHTDDKVGQIYIITGGGTVAYSTDVYDYDFEVPELITVKSPS